MNEIIYIFAIYGFISFAINLFCLLPKVINKILDFFDKKKKSKPSLRDKCIEAYGEEFGNIYDKLNSGTPVADFYDTAKISQMIDDIIKESK